MRIAYLTAGTVGAGHFVRGLAIARGLDRAGFTGTYRMFGPRLPYPVARRCELYQEVPVREERAALTHPQLAQTSTLAARLRDFAPDLLVVDLFWAAVRWILPALDVEAWLLVRSCPAAWLRGTNETPFAAGQYRRILGIEPIAHAAAGETIDPIVICNRDECRPKAALRERLGVPAGRPLAVVLHAGETGDEAALSRAAAGSAAVTLDLFAEDALFPAAEWLAGADRIWSGAGYNAFWEARWLGHARSTTFLPLPRSIDDQAARLRACAGHQPRHNGADVLARSILGR
jgi:hypothetical protein